MPKRKKAHSGKGVIYARYSSHAQKDASIEQQVEKATEYARNLDIPIIEIYSDRAVSGKTDKRKDFQRMMKDAEKGQFNYVIAWKSNRMGRNMLQAMMNEAKLQELGIRVLYTEESFDDTAAGRFALRSMMNVNQFYSENMAEDIKRGLYDNASQCKITNGNLPFGYKKGDDMRYAIDESKAEIVREIFTRVLCGDSFIDIANDLNNRGIKTSLGRSWGRGSFHAMLSNERYTGVYIYGDVRIDGGVPQIIDKGLFYRVQEVLKTKRNPQGKGRHRATGEDYLLTGKLFCGHCQSHMVGVSGTGRSGKLHHYYTCQKKRLEKSCNKRNVRRDQIENAVAQAICSYVLQDDIINWIADSTVEYSKKQSEQSHLSILEDNLNDNKRAIRNLMAAIEQGIITETTKNRLLELEKEQSQLIAKIECAKSEIITVSREDIIAGLELFRNGNVSDKKYQAQLFDTFLVAVYLYDDDMKIVFSFTGNSKNSIKIPLEPSIFDDSEGNLESEKVRIDAPLSHQNINHLLSNGNR